MGLALAGLAWMAMAWATQRLQAARCPADAFFWASSQIATALQIVPLFFPALGVGFLAANGIVASIPKGAEFFSQSRNDRGMQPQLIKFCLLLLAVAAPVSLGAGLSQFCLQPESIVYRPYPWAGFQHYGWRDLATVTAACRYRRGRYAGWRKQFILGMWDGTDLDLMIWPAAAVSAYPEIARALRGQAFRFDSSGVEPRCPPPYLGMLTQRP